MAGLASVTTSEDPGLPQGNDIAPETLARVGTMLESALVQHSVQVSAALQTGPVRDELRAVLAQLSPLQILHVMQTVATADLADRREVLEALLAADPSGSGEALRATLHGLHRQALLACMFHPDRVQALRRACRSLAQEPA